jgi:uncharacterized coiled-coil protein SlyX
MFGDNNEMKNRILDLELKLEVQERELSELKTMMLELSLMIHNMQTQMNNLLDKHKPKSL